MPFGRQRRARPVGRVELYVERLQGTRQVGNAISICDREQGSHDLLQRVSVELARGSSRRALHGRPSIATAPLPAGPVVAETLSSARAPLAE
jgi:hypothetical protein